MTLGLRHFIVSLPLMIHAFQLKYFRGAAAKLMNEWQSKTKKHKPLIFQRLHFFEHFPTVGKKLHIVSGF